MEGLEAEGMINANIFFDIGFFLNHEEHEGHEVKIPMKFYLSSWSSCSSW
jgi:hypothetical protein